MGEGKYRGCVFVCMREALARCIDCRRLYRVEYEETPPSSDDLICRCGTTRFERVAVEQAAETRGPARRRLSQ